MIQEINEEPVFSEKKQKKRKFKKRFFWLKRILICVLFIATLVLLALSPLCNIGKIEVEGNKYCKKEEIVGATDIMVGKNAIKTIGNNIKNLFTLRYSKAEESIMKSNPYIKSAVVRYVLFDKIKIVIEEREPFGVIPFMGTNLIIDKEGIVLDTVNKNQSLNKPIINGIKFSAYELGQALKMERRDKFEDASTVLAKVMESDKQGTYKFYDRIKSIDASDAGKIRLLVDAKVTVNLGNTDNLEYKINFMKEIFKKHIRKEDRGILDFTTGENPNFIPEQ
ncbi:MAG: FtsQ-type POTRA domain-containing protein [Clostridia bacterium]|nr:FtsQ-type POTRA domain-containing protein [Clostridia bacterium]